MNSLQKLFLEELATAADAERRQIRTLPKLVASATCQHLRKALQVHLKESAGHLQLMGRVFNAVGSKLRFGKCQAMAGLIQDCAASVLKLRETHALNASLVSGFQKIEHNEIAAYGFLHAWAGLLRNKEAARLLKGILSEETAAHQTLTDLARERSNPEALGSVEITAILNGKLPKGSLIRSRSRTAPTPSRRNPRRPRL